MKNIQNNPAAVIVISLIVILAITAWVFNSSTSNSVMTNTSVTTTTTVTTSESPATSSAVQQSTAKKSYVPTSSSGVVSQISTLHGQATATMYCAAPTTGRCQTGTGYAQFGVKIYQNTVLIQAIKLATDGTFDLRLQPGSYTVYPDWYTPGIAVNDTWTTDLPKTVTLLSGHTTSVAFTIDYTQY